VRGGDLHKGLKMGRGSTKWRTNKGSVVLTRRWVVAGRKTQSERRGKIKRDSKTRGTSPSGWEPEDYKAADSCAEISERMEKRLNKKGGAVLFKRETQRDHGWKCGESSGFVLTREKSIYKSPTCSKGIRVSPKKPLSALVSLSVGWAQGLLLGHQRRPLPVSSRGVQTR